MAKATKKVSKKANFGLFNDYFVVTLEDLQAREYKCMQQLLELRACLNYINVADRQQKRLDVKADLLEKWKSYVHCDPLPKPYLTPDIRAFYEKKKIYENRSVERNIDWSLPIDERSILTQNVARVDKTRRNVELLLKEDFGPEYDKCVNDSLKIIRSIECYLSNDSESLKAKTHLLEDITEIKTNIQKEISDSFNRYTYRIISSEDVYMNPVNALTLEYCFAGENFEIHLWTLKNVPIRFTHIQEPRMMAYLYKLNLSMHIPYSMLRHGMTIQAIHMNFDHISEYAKSFKQEIPMSVRFLNAGIQDLSECLVNEFKMQLDIQNRVRKKIMDKYREYEEQVLAIKQAEEAAAKNRKKGQKKVVTPSKMPQAPQFLSNDEFPDIYPDFLIEEQQEFELFINTFYNPKIFKLSFDQINLKKYCILGGVYQLNFVQKPKQAAFDYAGINMTWHTEEHELLIEKHLYIPEKRLLPSKRSIRYSISEEQAKAEAISTETGALDESVDPENPWFVLTFKLPDYLCYWSEPIACHYELIEEIVEVTQEARTSEEEVRRQTKLFQDRDSAFAKILVDDINMGSILVARGMSLVPSRSNFFAPSATSLRLSMKKEEQHHYEEDGVLYLNDFSLKRNFNIAQVRNIQRHCVPHLLSSYKFPKEIKEEEIQAALRSRRRGTTILPRKRDDIDELEEKSTRLFTFDEMQNNPERLYMFFDKTEDLYIANHLREFQGYLPSEPETFYQLVRTLTLVKRLFQFNVRHILELEPHKPQIDFQTYRKKKLEKQRRKEKKLEKAEVSPDRKGRGRSTRATIRPSVRAPSKAFISRTTSRASTSPASRASVRTAVRSSVRQVARPSTGSSRVSAKFAARRRSSVSPFFARASRRGTIGGLKMQTGKPRRVEKLADWEDTTSSEEDIDKKAAVKKEDDTEKTKTITYSHWTTKYIKRQSFDKAQNKYIIETDRLAFSFHLPRGGGSPENEVVFTLDTQHVRCVLYITGEGIRGHVTDPSKKYIRNPKMYLVIDEPLKDYAEFKRRFKEKNLNIFAEHDARFYIENGYFSEKHLAMELHTYCCMALHSTQMKYGFSEWNRLSKRRDIILKYVQYQDDPQNTVVIHVTPEAATFVEVQELCSINYNDINLAFIPTWRNINPYCDLHQTICSLYPNALDLRCRNSKLICCLRSLLSEIRPLSYS
uniref:CASC1 C-terminal domain-containing protein n=1 Tax=Glossina pallidipes TaxID=7398 RepID=A0A1A9ZL83_GLOPL